MYNYNILYTWFTVNSANVPTLLKRYLNILSKSYCAIRLSHDIGKKQIIYHHAHATSAWHADELQVSEWSASPWLECPSTGWCPSQCHHPPGDIPSAWRLKWKYHEVPFFCTTPSQTNRKSTREPQFIQLSAKGWHAKITTFKTPQCYHPQPGTTLCKSQKWICIDLMTLRGFESLCTRITQKYTKSCFKSRWHGPISPHLLGRHAQRSHLGRQHGGGRLFSAVLPQEDHLHLVGIELRRHGESYRAGGDVRGGFFLEQKYGSKKGEKMSKTWVRSWSCWYMLILLEQIYLWSNNWCDEYCNMKR